VLVAGPERLGARDHVASIAASRTLISIKFAGAAPSTSATAMRPAPGGIDVSHGRGALKLALATFIADGD
jgi:hypothetical protein